jgi:peptide/nickel transport system permease protein
VVRRFFWAIVVFFLATLITYVIFFVISSDPSRYVDFGAAGVTRAQARGDLHLDVPIWQQYWIFMWTLFGHQSLGYSFRDGTSVRHLLFEEAPVTASLIVGSLLLCLLIAIPVGIISALRPRSLFDRVGTVLVLVGISMSPVVLGLVLQYLIAYKLKLTPTSGYCSFTPQKLESLTCSGPRFWFSHLILPWITVSALFAALYARMIRSQILEGEQEEYVRTARAKGAPERRVLTQHVLRNCMLPLVTMLGMDITLVLGSAIFVERVFNLHGIGYQVVDSATHGDVPVVVGIAVLATVVVIVVNFIVDVAYAWLDPRITLSGEAA